MHSSTRILIACAICLPLRSVWALTAPNVVAISDRLVTAGQPSAAALAALGGEGFEVVVSLVPSSVHAAVPDEAEILRRQGIAFVHIPIPFAAPTDEHVRAVAAALAQAGPRKTLVHCELNFRASTLTFLYRVLHLRETPARAYEAVSGVWVPQGRWRQLLTEQLAKGGVRFDPY